MLPNLNTIRIIAWTMKGEVPSTGDSHNKLVVLYDGFCPVCRRSARIIRKIDLLGAVKLLRYQDFDLSDLPVPIDKITSRIQACDSDLKNCREGIFAFSSILIRIPPMFPFSVLSYIAGKLGFGQRIYDYISENRYNLPLSGVSRIFVRKNER